MQTLKLSKEELLLYFVTSKDPYSNRDLCYTTKEAILGGTTIVQYREKSKSYEEMKKECLLLKDLCDEYDIKLIINDHVNLAKEVDAHGVHIGQDDESFKKTRDVIGIDKIIGVSVFNESQALEAQKQGADYLGVGAIFETNSKNDAKYVTLDTLKTITQEVSIPVVAIGGITLNNIEKFKYTNIDGVALISAIINNKDIKCSTKVLHKKINQILN
ncbi:MAG TPA: thiamine phosphate synthase [Sulfurospirillum arcachonense]|nr:thiamine phosphate synthase [Sulfurospirillum arcachonense]HIP45289.1 thiamine phosphate synthase [Sulfurospirillum arcachonense]